MKKSCIVVATVFMLFFVGCNEARLTSLQRKQLESKDLHGKYENAYKATLQVLQDHGYAIKNTDHASGVIHGETGKEWNMWLETMEWLEITATIEQFGDDTVKERLSILKKIKRSSQYGTHENSEMVEDPELFAKIYDDIQKEMFIRQNINK